MLSTFPVTSHPAMSQHSIIFNCWRRSAPAPCDTRPNRRRPRRRRRWPVVVNGTTVVPATNGLRCLKSSASACLGRRRIVLSGSPTSITSFRQRSNWIQSSRPLLLLFPPRPLCYGPGGAGTAKNRKKKTFGHNMKIIRRVNVQIDNRHPKSGRTRDTGRTRRMFKDVSVQTTDAPCIRLEDNVDSLRLPTVGVPACQQNNKKLTCLTKENTINKTVVHPVDSDSVSKPPHRKNNWSHIEDDRKNPDAIPKKIVGCFGKISRLNPIKVRQLWAINHIECLYS